MCRRFEFLVSEALKGQVQIWLKRRDGEGHLAKDAALRQSFCGGMALPAQKCARQAVLQKSDVKKDTSIIDLNKKHYFCGRFVNCPQ